MMSKTLDTFEYVVKRNGEKEKTNYKKIENRVYKLGQEAGIDINYSELVRKVVATFHNGITTTEIDLETAKYCESKFTSHPNYCDLAARIVISNHQKNTNESFLQVVTQLWNFRDCADDHRPLVSKSLYEIAVKRESEINVMIDHKRDYLIDYFGFVTLHKSYLMKYNGVPIERIQHMWMRVAIGIHGDDMDKVKETYDLMSQKYYIHATPTLFNAGTPRSQLSSCFLLKMQDDSITGIYKTLADCAQISKYAGGIGVNIHNIRAKNSHIRETNGTSNGIVPMLRVFNETARYVDQGGGKRKGSIAIYIEPWHADIFDFLQMKTNSGSEMSKARDLFYALWIPDLFMKRVKAGGIWSLFCPDKAKGLADVYGAEFEQLYERYESEGRANMVVNAVDLWNSIITTQIETGVPYLCYKDTINSRSNQKHSGIIKGSNLCAEIALISNERETAVCNLASIVLPSFVSADGVFDYEKFHAVTKTVVKNVDKVIDVNFYPVPEARYSNMRHRPIGVGVQGLQDVFFKMNVPFESNAAADINVKIFETMYHAAIESSVDLAKERFERLSLVWDNRFDDPEKFMADNNLTREELDLPKWYCGAYATFVGSPASQGMFQFDMCDMRTRCFSDRYDWAKLRGYMMHYGMRNSQLISLMPTASTSLIHGCTECFQPQDANFMTRRSLAGDCTIVNKYMMNALIGLGLWNDDLKQKIVLNRGSIANIAEIPAEIKAVYKTNNEMKMKPIIDMAADRGQFVCQTQSMNLWVNDVSHAKISAMHFYGWQNGLKTGQYYMYCKQTIHSQNFTVEPEQKAKSAPAQVIDEPCLMCSA